MPGRPCKLYLPTLDPAPCSCLQWRSKKVILATGMLRCCEARFQNAVHPALVPSKTGAGALPLPHVQACGTCCQTSRDSIPTGATASG